MKKFLPSSIFFISGVVFFLVTARSLLWVVWGGPSHWTQFVALFGSMGLCLSAIVFCRAPTKGVWIARGSIVAVAILFVPAIVDLVPAHNTTSPLWGFVTFGFFFTIYSFAFLFPKIRKWSASVVLFTFILSAIVYGITYTQRASSGEYAWPTFDFYMIEGGEKLSVGRDHMDVLSEEDIFILSSLGLKGEINWFGRSGQPGNASVIVICRGRIAEPKRIHFPKSERVFFVFQNDRWITIPENYESMDRFVTLQPDGMLSQQLSSGGVQSSRVFMSW